MRGDLDKMLKEAEKLHKAARSIGKRLGFPFVAEGVVELASVLPTRDLLGPGGRKLVLREVAVLLGLDAHDRPKKAAQYSSGIMREMERLAKKDGLTMSEWTERTARAKRATD
jgi:asparagine synthase (glutamine-hydrolysing)